MTIHNFFSVNLINSVDEAVHLHPDIEVLYVIDGTAQVVIQDKKYCMKRGDIIVINSSIQHCISATKKITLYSIWIDYRIIAEVMQLPCIFNCNSCEENRNYGKLRSVLSEMVKLESRNHKTESYKYSLLFKLLNVLAEYYMIEIQTDTGNAADYCGNIKLQVIVYYVFKNMDNHLSLAKIARQLYVSTSTLSRFFKKQTGIYFNEYVADIRRKYCEGGKK